MSTPAQIQEAINRTEHEIAQLKIQNGRIPSLRHELAAVNAGYTLNPTPEAHARLERVSNELAEASKAVEQLSIKMASIGLLERELADAKADERRERCIGIVDNFDRLKVRYAQDAEALLSIFRQMHRLHIQHLDLTGRPLMYEVDYTLQLPPCNPPANASWATTGNSVRS